MSDVDELHEKRDYYLKTIMELEYRKLVDETELEKQETERLKKVAHEELGKVNSELAKIFNQS